MYLIGKGSIDELKVWFCASIRGFLFTLSCCYSLQSALQMRPVDVFVGRSHYISPHMLEICRCLAPIIVFPTRSRLPHTEKKGAEIPRNTSSFSADSRLLALYFVRNVLELLAGPHWTDLQQSAALTWTFLPLFKRSKYSQVTENIWERLEMIYEVKHSDRLLFQTVIVNLFSLVSQRPRKQAMNWIIWQQLLKTTTTRKREEKKDVMFLEMSY